MKAVFLDRDGVINELVYHRERGIIDSPFTAEQFRLLPGVAEAIRRFHGMDYGVVVVSNQPGIAKGHLSWETFGEIREKMKRELARGGLSSTGSTTVFITPRRGRYPPV
jgi:D-glycero-D-manno-heptose 1,7-bisphosphate phosphatase